MHYQRTKHTYTNIVNNRPELEPSSRTTSSSSTHYRTTYTYDNSANN